MMEAIKVLEGRISELEIDYDLSMAEFQKGVPYDMEYGNEATHESIECYKVAMRISRKIEDYKSAILDLKKARGWWIEGVVDRETLISHMQTVGYKKISAGEFGEMWRRESGHGVVVMYNLNPDDYEWRGVLERVTGNLRTN